jgi:peptidoglycan/LPS O-acetylase OafA/YrhL
MSNSVTTVTKYRPDIDGLRAIAVGAVLLFHCGVFGFGGGYVGVDVFFVISGYLITGHLAQDIALDRLSIRSFYARRLRRIAPALFVMLIVTWLLAALLFLPSYLVNTSDALIAAAGSVSNIYLWKTLNYFAPDALFQPLLHTWSLSVEEQFYAVIPVTMAIASRWLRGRWVLLFGPACLASFALSVYATTTAPTANFYFLPTRAWELGIGSLLATTPLPIITRRWAAEVTGIAGLLLLAVPIHFFDDATPFPGLSALCPCIGSALLIHVGRSPRSVATTMLASKPFVWVGLISYSVYLVHWPIVVFVRYSTVAPLTGLQIAGVIGASLLLGSLSWRFIEQPFRRPILSINRVLLGGVASIAVACLVGFVGVRANGFPTRFPNFTERAIVGHDQWNTGTCFLTGNPNYRSWSLDKCTRIATGPHKVLLWGDSFAAQYVPGILANAAALKTTVIQYTAAGCPPVLSYRSYARVLCSEFNAHALDIIREEGIDTVVLSARWTDMRQRGFAEIGSTLSALQALGIHVILIGQSPEFVEDVQVVAFLKGSESPDAMNRWTVFFGASINDQLAAVAGHGSRFINPMPALCSGLMCLYQDKGAFLFEDYGHYSAEGSRRVVQDLLVVQNLLAF